MAVNYDKWKLSTGTHYIVNSGKDENGGTKGGKAGDQTGREAEIRAYYVRPWTVVLRYLDQAVANVIANLAIDMALNDKVGYDQGQRTTYWKQLQAAGYDPSKITVACEEDCTAGVSANVKAAGYIFGIKALQDVPICSSRNMRQEFVKAGFIALTASKYLTSGNYLLPGDILLYESHHAATNVTLGKDVREQWNPGDVPTPAPGPDPEPVPEGPVLEITGNVHIRREPRKDSESLGIAQKGDRLPWGGWYPVAYNGEEGWVSGKYARPVE